MTHRQRSGRVCSLPACNRKHEGLGYCSFHYRRHKRGIPLDAPYYYNHSRITTCKFKGCDEIKKAKGYCNTHYHQQRKGLPVTPIKKLLSTEGHCEAPECTNPIKAKRLCGCHYKRMREGRPLDTPYRSRPKKPRRECSVNNCQRLATRKGMCGLHMRRWLRGDRGDKLERPIERYRKHGMLGIMAGHDYSKGRPHRDYAPSIPTTPEDLL